MLSTYDKNPGDMMSEEFSATVRKDAKSRNDRVMFTALKTFQQFWHSRTNVVPMAEDSV